MEQAKVPHAGHLAQLDANHVARMSPILLDGDCIGEREHAIEDHEVRVLEEIDKAFGLPWISQLVFRVRPFPSKR